MFVMHKCLMHESAKTLSFLMQFHCFKEGRKAPIQSLSMFYNSISMGPCVFMAPLKCLGILRSL